MINVVLYQPEISPNTGNIIRSCYATGAKLHIIKPTAFDIHPKWFKRPSAGKYLSDIEHEIHESYEDFKNKYGNEVIYYVTRYGKQYHSTPDYKKHKNDIFLMYGRESTGIPLDILRDNLKMCIRVPMTPNCRSLNLANTVMMTVYEVSRQLGYPELSQFEIQKGADWLIESKYK